MWEPFGVANNTAGWRSGPNERGTLHILSTCIFTLVLCIYTCLHLNIPGPNERTWMQRVKRKSLWLLMGLFAPEFIAFMAVYDWYLAKKMTDYMKKTLDPLIIDHRNQSSVEDVEDTTVDSEPRSMETSKVAGRSHSWTHTHSHYALMGGYAFDMTRLPINFAPNEASTLTLTTNALRKLAAYEPHLIPDLSVDEIRDKSKADNVTKAIVCVQATWFAAQIIGRLSTRCPISLLEMNTSLHALCCLMIYMAWWHKPLDIEEPSLIDINGKGAQSICAWLIMYSTITTIGKVYRDPKVEGPIPKVSLVYCNESRVRLPSWSQKDVDEAIRINRESGRAATVDPSTLDTPWSPPGAQCDSYLTLYSGQSCYDYCFWATQWRGHVPPQFLSIRLSRAEVECLRLSSKCEKTIPNTTHEAMIKYKSETVLFQPVHVFQSDTELVESSQIWSSRVQNVFGDSLHNPQARFLLIVFCTGISAAGTVYGGTHLLAWHSRFPSPVERYMWRASCFIIAVPFPAIVLLGMAMTLRHAAKVLVKNSILASMQKMKATNATCFTFSLWNVRMQHILAWLSRRCIEVFVIIYAAARVFLIVESFINLAHLPDGVFKTPEWSKYLPHIASG